MLAARAGHVSNAGAGPVPRKPRNSGLSLISTGDGAFEICGAGTRGPWIHQEWGVCAGRHGDVRTGDGEMHGCGELRDGWRVLARSCFDSAGGVPASPASPEEVSGGGREGGWCHAVDCRQHEGWGACEIRLCHARDAGSGSGVAVAETGLGSRERCCAAGQRRSRGCCGVDWMAGAEAGMEAVQRCSATNGVLDVVGSARLVASPGSSDQPGADSAAVDRPGAPDRNGPV